MQINSNGFSPPIHPIKPCLGINEKSPNSNNMTMNKNQKICLPSFKELDFMLNDFSKNHVITQQTTVMKTSQTKKLIKSQQKYKKIKQNRCHSCNSTETPEWRKGPLGPRTLCNACGLIWTKLCKTESNLYENDDLIEDQIYTTPILTSSQFQSSNSRKRKHELSFLLT